MAPPSLFAMHLYKNGTWSFGSPKPSFEVVQECTILYFHDTLKPLKIQAFSSISVTRKLHLKNMKITSLLHLLSLLFHRIIHLSDTADFGRAFFASFFMSTIITTHAGRWDVILKSQKR